MEAQWATGSGKYCNRILSFENKQSIVCIHRAFHLWQQDKDRVPPDVSIHRVSPIIVLEENCKTSL